MPMMDPDNKARLIEWAIDSSGENKTLFPQPLVLDYEALAEYEPPQPAEEPGIRAPKPERI